MKFSFQSYGKKASPDDDVLTSRGEARALRAHLRAKGWDARVEASGALPPEYRVWCQHPDQPTWCAYVHRGSLKPTGFVPYWIEK